MNPAPKLFSRNLLLLILCQGLFLTNNVTFIAINGLVGLNISPTAWMASLPVMGYVVGGALSTSLVAKTQHRYGRKKSFQLGLAIASLSSLICAYAAWTSNFWLLTIGTLVAGYYSANGYLYNNAGSSITFGATWTNGDVIGVAFDAGNRTLQFYKNNVLQHFAIYNNKYCSIHRSVGLWRNLNLRLIQALARERCL